MLGQAIDGQEQTRICTNSMGYKASHLVHIAVIIVNEQYLVVSTSDKIILN